MKREPERERESQRERMKERNRERDIYTVYIERDRERVGGRDNQ